MNTLMPMRQLSFKVQMSWMYENISNHTLPTIMRKHYPVCSPIKGPETKKNIIELNIAYL